MKRTQPNQYKPMWRLGWKKKRKKKKQHDNGTFISRINLLTWWCLQLTANICDSILGRLRRWLRSAAARLPSSSRSRFTTRSSFCSSFFSHGLGFRMSVSSRKRINQGWWKKGKGARPGGKGGVGRDAVGTNRQFGSDSRWHEAALFFDVFRAQRNELPSLTAPSS